MAKTTKDVHDKIKRLKSMNMEGNIRTEERRGERNQHGGQGISCTVIQKALATLQ